MNYDALMKYDDMVEQANQQQMQNQSISNMLKESFAGALQGLSGGTSDALGVSLSGFQGWSYAGSSITADSFKGNSLVIAGASKLEEEEFSDTVSDEQKLVQKIAVMSDCNVVIQGKKVGYSSGGFSFGGSAEMTKYRMFCEKCKGSYNVPSADWIVNGKHQQPEIVKFCKEHKHGIEAKVEQEGRKFRDI